jgi:hypothetical protein
MMRILWKCTHENGFVSFVLARTKIEAISILAGELEVLPDIDDLEPVDHREPFFVTFFPCYDDDNEIEEKAPHWHAATFLSSQGLLATLGEPPPRPETPAEPPPPAETPAEPPPPTEQVNVTVEPSE